MKATRSRAMPSSSLGCYRSSCGTYPCREASRSRLDQSKGRESITVTKKLRRIRPE